MTICVFNGLVHVPSCRKSRCGLFVCAETQPCPNSRLVAALPVEEAFPIEYFWG